MDTKSKDETLIRTASLKKAKLRKEEMRDTPGKTIPIPSDAELNSFTQKYPTSVEFLTNWMGYYSNTIKQIQGTQNPTDETLNDFVASADIYGITGNQVLPVLIQAAVLDQKYMVDATRIMVNAPEGYANYAKPWSSAPNKVQLSDLLTSADKGKISVKVVRGQWYTDPQTMHMNMELVLDFIKLAKQHPLFLPIRPHLPQVT